MAPDVAAISAVPESKESRKFTWEEVAQHNRPESLWFTVRGKVYDLTNFAKRHPGGQDILRAAAGRDVTQTFEVYHDLAVKDRLKKFYIGDLVSDEFPTFPEPSPFFVTLKNRVKKYFEETKQDPRFAPWMFVRYAVILGTIGLGWYCTYLSEHFKGKWWAQAGFAVLTGFAQAQTGLMPLHDSSHFAITNKPWVWKLFGSLHDIVNGTSHLQWLYQHILGHHAYTNIPGADPDISVQNPDVRRIWEGQTWLPRYLGQEFVIPPLYGALGTMTRKQDIEILYVTYMCDKIRSNPVGSLDGIIFWGGKLFWLWSRVIVPLQLLGLRAVPFILISDMVASYWLALLFQANHVVGEVEWPLPDPKTNQIERDWAEHQISTSQDYAHGSWFWTVFSGALNYQAVHHVFANVNQYYYPEIAPIVLKTCEEFGVKYHHKATAFEAVMSHLIHLRKLGKKPKVV
ncbi:delta-5 fatty acid desaturase [Gonapodya prolifera JEL478]|uniref:Delta-5 fatty acid desaturase n=1 Tax=Gonapodya prolifera (strain JEL478) TaxID=1344416 RepID=A0A139AE60_GONPJ|nr:delta-5 fatty acid desaturase [Gonapodya prolifera JEL478]|eukprot:KXS15116.1 delta-5 fatty acid desaturase [Gonapodya prolifera JEL478]